MNQHNRTIFIALGVLLLLLLLSPMLMMGPGVIGRGMMGWGYSGDVTGDYGWLRGLGMGLGGLMMLAVWAVPIVGIVFFFRWITGQPASGSGPTVAEDPMTILGRRYAAGEIDQPTYERMKSELENAASRPRQPVGVNGR